MAWIFYTIVSIYLIIYELILWYRIRRNFTKHSARRTFTILWWAAAATLHTPLLLMIYSSVNSLRFPAIDGWKEAAYSVFASWLHPLLFSFPVYLGGLLILAMISLIAEGILFIKKRIPESGIPSVDPANPYSSGHVTSQTLSRRQLLSRAWDFFPFVLMGSSLTAMAADRDSLKINKLILKYKNLPWFANGIKILHISDLHTGHLIHSGKLSEILKASRKLKADILITTGDLIDNNNAYLPDLAEFLTEVRKTVKYAFAVSGNHEWIDNGEEVYESLQRAGIRSLKHESVYLPPYGVSITGLDFRKEYMRDRKLRRTDTLQAYTKLQPKIRGFNIVLSHFPDLYSDLKANNLLKGTDLFLAGHTHGGQFVIKNQDHTGKGDSGPAASVLEYSGGLYREDNSFLYVNRGAGHWYPLRVNCPREIALITLKRADNKKAGY